MNLWRYNDIIHLNWVSIEYVAWLDLTMLNMREERLRYIYSL